MFKNMLLSASLIYELVICTYTFIIGSICIYATAALQLLYIVIAVHTYITHMYSIFIPVHIVHIKTSLSIKTNRYIFMGLWKDPRWKKKRICESEKVRNLKLKVQ